VISFGRLNGPRAIGIRKGKSKDFNEEPGLWIFVNLLFFCSTNLIERAIAEGSQREANVERISRNRRLDEGGNKM